MINRIIYLVSVFLLTVFCSACQHTSAVYTKAPKVKVAIVPQSLQNLYDEFHYAPAIRMGNMLYLSGVVAAVSDADNGDMSLAISRAFDEIELVLTVAGASWADVVDVTSYMTDLDNQIGPLWAVKEQRVPAPYPAWTAIGVKNLFGGSQAIMEIKVVAYMAE